MGRQHLEYQVWSGSNSIIYKIILANQRISKEKWPRDLDSILYEKQPHELEICSTEKKGIPVYVTVVKISEKLRLYTR